MELRIQVVSIVAASLLFLGVLEMVRRRRLLERYALLWLFSALALLGLAIWSGLLERISKTIGIIYPPNALFLIAFGFVMILLLHFSLAVSRLTDQTKVLAQRLALLEERQRGGSGAAAPAREQVGDEPALAGVEHERVVREPVAGKPHAGDR